MRSPDSKLRFPACRRSADHLRSRMAIRRNRRRCPRGRGARGCASGLRSLHGYSQGRDADRDRRLMAEAVGDGQRATAGRDRRHAERVVGDGRGRRDAAATSDRERGSGAPVVGLPCLISENRALSSRSRRHRARVGSRGELLPRDAALAKSKSDRANSFLATSTSRRAYTCTPISTGRSPAISRSRPISWNRWA